MDKYARALLAGALAGGLTIFALSGIRLFAIVAILAAVILITSPKTGREGPTGQRVR